MLVRPTINAKPNEIDVRKVRATLAALADPAEVIEVDAQLSAAEKYMRDSGRFSIDEMRPINEARMWATWHLGRLLAKVARASHDRRSVSRSGTQFRTYLGTLGLNKNRALEAQRIGAMPEEETEKALARAHKAGELCFMSDLLDVARPWWYQASRKIKHKIIAALARGKAHSETLGPFPLILADPPWKFHTYSEKGLDRTPDQHYPTLTDEEIRDFRVTGKPIDKIAATDAVLFLWCTSANVERALGIMGAWDFTYKAHAVWVKDRTGTGLVFRNKHEVLLYGTRGKMPGPQWQPPSVFEYPRGRHSEKPREVRDKIIARMYPDFRSKETRIELFARETVPGWTGYGFES